ncbi:lipase family protein [Streptomyces sp. 4F14]|uniref:lipase family protein n=1 Tax=Streptomyces sp. 4F14 TaxID=3394380 RepID=UPI003A8A4ED7
MSRTAANLPPGALRRAAPLPAALLPDGAGGGWRVSYHSTGHDHRIRTVTGMVLTPAAAPLRQGWPVLSYAHGTAGLDDACAPSRKGLFPFERDYLAHWLGLGYAVTVTDYQGVGGGGRHPYLHGESEAWAVTDVVRAARQLDLPFGRHWLVCGFSQGGHAALNTAAVAPGYAPELDFRGTLALAPPHRFQDMWARLTADPDAPLSPLLLLILEGLESVHRGFDSDIHLTPRGRALTRVADEATYYALLRDAIVHSPAEVLASDLSTDAEFQSMLAALDAPVGRFPQPVLIAHGLADTIADPAATARLAADLTAAGTDTTWEGFPDVDHTGILTASLPTTARWIDRVFGVHDNTPAVLAARGR